MENQQNLEQVQQLLKTLISEQKKRLLQCANEINPRVTEEDILQPNDFEELENNTFFRYEEGVLEGYQSAYAAVMALLRETIKS